MKNHWLRPVTLSIIFCLLTGLPAAAGSPAGPAAAAASDPGDSFNWWIVRPDAPLTFKNMSPHSLGITSNGVIHVVYGGDHLYHAWKSRGSWYFETVDPAWGVGSNAALAIDSADKLHISYIDAAADRLKYATNRSGSWQVETPPIADGLRAANAVIAVDAANDPHIVFFSYDGTLRYGTFDSGYGSWIGPETLAANTGLLDYPGAFAMAVGPLATPHVSFHKHVTASNGSLFYTKRTGYDTWSTPLDLATGGDSGGDYNDIALNGSIPHIAASSVSIVSPGSYLNQVRYTFLDGTTWHTSEMVTFTTNNAAAAPPAAISLRLVGSTPYIAYQDPGVGYFWLNRLGDNNWSTEEAVVSGAAAGNWASFAWYNGYPYATSYDSSTRLFSFIFRTAAGWQAPHTLATNGHKVGMGASLAVDNLGRSHIVYSDFTSMQLLYARYDGTASTHLEVDAGPAYSDSALALKNNLPSVLYFGTDGTVRYAYMLCAPTCNFIGPEIVDSGLTTPMYLPALAIHPTTGVQAAYYKNGSVIYARRTAADAWSTTPVDSGTYGGISMVLDASGSPHLMYHKGYNLIHATKDTAWHTDDIIATGTFGLENAFRISPHGVKASVYTEFTSGGDTNLVYAEWSCLDTVCGWLPYTIESSKGDFDFVDLAFDSHDVPHISYIINFGASLKYAVQTGGTTWTVQVIDSHTTVSYSSLAISPLNGRARIAYFDFINEDLKLALEGQPIFLPVVKK